MVGVWRWRGRRQCRIQKFSAFSTVFGTWQLACDGGYDVNESSTIQGDMHEEHHLGVAKALNEFPFLSSFRILLCRTFLNRAGTQFAQHD